VVGPTASGKTELAIELCERVGGEIVSADSVQVYRHFEIGTGKPDSSERARARHHLIDVIEPAEAMDAARFAELADSAITDIRARGRRPIVCGGTFLWVRALLFGLAPAPPGDPTVRQRHAELVERSGRAALHAELARVDESSARRLAPNDFVRVSRALEVFELTGVPLSRFQAQHGFREARHRARLVGVQREREEHDQRIAERCERMLDAGLIDEVRSLLARGFGASRAMGSVGYKQVTEALSRGGPIARAELHARMVSATRVFARRQRTWLRDEPVLWVRSASEVPI
jgi:tRNA dimethylallyltransferase